MLLVARTLNSYSTQGLNLVTVADSCFPPSSSGTERHHRNNLSSAPPPLLCHISRLKVSPAADVLFTAVSCERRFKRDNSLNLFLPLPARDLHKDRYIFWGVCGIGKSQKKIKKIKIPASCLLVTRCSACDKVLLLHHSRRDVGRN